MTIHNKTAKIPVSCENANLENARQSPHEVTLTLKTNFGKQTVNGFNFSGIYIGIAIGSFICFFGTMALFLVFG